MKKMMNPPSLHKRSKSTPSITVDHDTPMHSVIDKLCKRKYSDKRVERIKSILEDELVDTVGDWIQLSPQRKQRFPELFVTDVDKMIGFRRGTYYMKDWFDPIERLRIMFPNAVIENEDLIQMDSSDEEDYNRALFFGGEENRKVIHVKLRKQDIDEEEYPTRDTTPDTTRGRKKKSKVIIQKAQFGDFSPTKLKDESSPTDQKKRVVLNLKTNHFPGLDSNIKRLFREFICRWRLKRKFKKAKLHVINLQRIMRGFMVRKRIRTLKKFCIRIQRVWKIEFSKRKKACLIIQSHYRGYRVREDFQFHSAAALLIQQTVREYLSAKKRKEMFKEMEKIQQEKSQSSPEIISTPSPQLPKVVESVEESPVNYDTSIVKEAEVENNVNYETPFVQKDDNFSPQSTEVMKIIEPDATSVLLDHWRKSLDSVSVDYVHRIVKDDNKRKDILQKLKNLREATLEIKKVN